MNQKKEIDNLMKSSSEPEGVTVQAADGRVFFLTKQEAKRLGIPKTKLYSAYLQLAEIEEGARRAYKQSGSRRPVRLHPRCRGMKRWLDTHSHNSRKWRAICLWYFDNC